MYLHEKENWSNFTWKTEEINHLLNDLNTHREKLNRSVEALNMSQLDAVELDMLTAEIVHSSRIEGERLDKNQVRSSIALKLGIPVEGNEKSSDDDSDYDEYCSPCTPNGSLPDLQKREKLGGVVEMMVDAVVRSDHPFTQERLFGWHICLFPCGRSGARKIKVAQYRDDAGGPMRVVSGTSGKETVHFQAPDAKRLEHEMAKFLVWLNSDQQMDPVLKSAIAHFWFITIHPMEDGNGRISRAIAEMLLVKSEKSKRLLYSVSQQIENDKKTYYSILENVGKEVEDFTVWLKWYLQIVLEAIINAENKFFKFQQTPVSVESA